MNNRILIVEDNKTLAKVIAKKIAEAMEVQVDIAFDMSEAKLFLHKYKYFIALLDINLPDAPNGEIVDYVISTKNHILVLSENIDKEFRKKILNKNIIDYINKDGLDEIQYIIQTLQRLEKNKKHKILVVDDSIVFRKQMQFMLENMFYQVIVAKNGKEAFDILNKNTTDVSLVLTDYNMPIIDGLELTKKIRKIYNKNTLCILAISANDDDEISALFLKHGANDYINKPFSKEEFSVRINNSIESLENIQTITNYANTDYLTGLNNRRFFYNSMQKYINKNANNKFALAMIDIDYFKKVNDTYGHDAGDSVLISLSKIIQSFSNSKSISSRFGGEEFCIVLKDTTILEAKDLFEQIRQSVENFICKFNDIKIKFTISIGALMYDGNSLGTTIMEADKMLYKAKNSGRNKLIFKN